MFLLALEVDFRVHSLPHFVKLPFRLLGTTVAWMCGVCSSMCSTAETVFSLPNVRCSHCRVSSHHSPSLPSSCTLIMSSCVPESTMRIALTWPGVIFRLMPAVQMRWFITSVRFVCRNGFPDGDALRVPFAVDFLLHFAIVSHIFETVPFNVIPCPIKCHGASH